MDLEPWAVVKHSPPELQRQMDGYSCGFFVIHGMRVVGESESLSRVTNDQTVKVRSDTLNLILNNLAYVPFSLHSTGLISPLDYYAQFRRHRTMS